MLEIGPGPGAATDWLRHRVKRLTAVEIDAEAAATLADRYARRQRRGGRRRRDRARATRTGPSTRSARSRCCTTFRRARCRTRSWPRPSGCSGRAACSIGSDSLASNDLHHFHADDTYNPVDPSRLLVRLQTLGFGKITIMVDWDLKFVARKPDGQDAAATPGRRTAA